MTNFTVTAADSSGGHGGQLTAIAADMLAVAQALSAYVPGTGDIAIAVTIDPAVPTADGGSAASVQVGSEGGIAVYSQGMASEIATGVDPNGAEPDVLIRVGSQSLADWYFVDPSPATDDDIPADRTDLMSVLLHELLHGLAFNGWRDADSGAITGNAMSTYDTQVEVIGGAPFFTGELACAVYGDNVPLTPGNYAHYATPGDGHAGLLGGVMNGNAFPNGIRFGVSDLDLAILHDCGVRVQDQVAGSAGADTLATLLPAHVQALGGNDVLTGSNFDDVLDGGAGLDHAVYGGPRAAYAVSGSGAALGIQGPQGLDSLVEIERIAFADLRVAFDLDGNAGLVARLGGALFGAAILQDRGLVGQGLARVDAGVSAQALAQEALGSTLFLDRAGSHGNVDFVELLFRNLTGREGSAQELAPFVEMLDAGSLTQAGLALEVAASDHAAVAVDLAGLRVEGLDYI